MITPSFVPSQPMLPLHGFIDELRKLGKSLDTQTPDALLPFVTSAYEALQTLRDHVEQLPDLSPGRWFLQAHYLAACHRVARQLEVAKRHLLLLSVKANEGDDSFDILPFATGFMQFAHRAADSPAVFQQPYQLEFTLRIPEPPRNALDDILSDAGLDSDYLPL